MIKHFEYFAFFQKFGVIDSSKKKKTTTLIPWSDCTTLKVIRSLCCSHYTTFSHGIWSLASVMGGVTHLQIPQVRSDVGMKSDPSSPSCLCADLQRKKQEETESNMCERMDKEAAREGIIFAMKN